MVSRYGMRISRVITSTPYLRVNFSIMLSTWVSPIAVKIVCLVSAFFSRVMVGSSSKILWIAPLSLSSSPLLLGSMAMLRVGLGKSIGSNMTGLAFVHKVSPVPVTDNLATAPISPAWSSGTLACSLPVIINIWAIFSSFSLLALYTTESALR